MNDNYPLGAANDPNAPYNEPLNKTYRVEVSAELGFFIDVDVYDEYDIKDKVNEAIRDKYQNENVVVNEVTIWDYRKI